MDLSPGPSEGSGPRILRRSVFRAEALGRTHTGPTNSALGYSQGAQYGSIQE